MLRIPAPRPRRCLRRMQVGRRRRGSRPHPHLHARCAQPRAVATDAVLRASLSRHADGCTMTRRQPPTPRARRRAAARAPLAAPAALVCASSMPVWPLACAPAPRMPRLSWRKQRARLVRARLAAVARMEASPPVRCTWMGPRSHRGWRPRWQRARILLQRSPRCARSWLRSRRRSRLPYRHGPARLTSHAGTTCVRTGRWTLPATQCSRRC